ncbi:MAG: molybdopterin biosynthesis protein [Syntrophorhabdaceae bacterium]|nr:molybdopterin biosynthesis protein [Syntrophorhabdaceae bacterium]
MKRYLKTLKKRDAIGKILEYVRPIEDEEAILTKDGIGRVTSRAVYAKISNPPFLCSAMDGYAVDYRKTFRADLTNPVTLKRQIDTFPVNTGDPLPRGTDAVIMVEEVEENEEGITIRRPVFLWQNVRMVGEDVIEGDMLIPSNHRITAYDMGMLISGGIKTVSVKRRPRISIIPTGKELIDIFCEPEEEIKEGRLIDFNTYTLFYLAQSMGFEVDKREIARNRASLVRILRDAIQSSDVVILNAGTSAGKEDYTGEIIEEMGTLLFHGVSMMPGKPTLFGLIENKPVVGIPGYPVSAVVSFNTFITPLYERLMGIKLYRDHVRVHVPYHMPSRIGIEEIIRVNLLEKDGRFYAFPLPRGASIFSSMAKADGLINIPEEIEGYEEEREVECELLVKKGQIKNRLHVIGSHDLSLDILRDMLRRKDERIDLVSNHTGSLSGILALRKGITSLSTTHILDEKERVYNIPALKRYLPGRRFTLIHIAKRSQGLVVQKGNPKGIKGIGDLIRPDIKFINRQAGSGTRILLDIHLKDMGVEKGMINGYDREESSHTAVGVLVKESIADVGLAIYSIARIFSLDFIPIAEEEYDLIVAEEFMGDFRFELLMESLKSKEFKSTLVNLGGYDTTDTGSVKYVNR